MSCFVLASYVLCLILCWLNDDAGYTLRHLHETKVEQRLDSIEKAVSVSAEYGVYNVFTD